MEFRSHDKLSTITLLNCPFCWGLPTIKYNGNDYTGKRTITIKCQDCGAKRQDSASSYGFRALEIIAAKAWNRRQ